MGISRRHLWGLTAVLLLASFLIAAVAPPEKTLGTGIRVVYVHVTLTWVGMIGLVVASLLGLGVLVTDKKRLAGWMQTIGWVGLGFYAAGTAVSLLASYINWGAVFWQEPRMVAAFNVIALGVIVHTAALWISSRRVMGLLNFLLAGIMLWLTYGAPLVLHPREAISTSDAAGIQATFLLLFGIYGVTAVLLIWLWHQKRVAIGN